MSEIKYLRGMRDFIIDRRNSNRYRIMVKEALGHTAYCFSTPIYNVDTEGLVHTDFHKTGDGYYFCGSNGTISVCKNRCVLENREGRMIVSLADLPSVKGVNYAAQSAIAVTPTLNGLKFEIKGKAQSILLKSEIDACDIRFHSTCFSIMKEKFKPFASVATLYAVDAKGMLFPAEIRYRDKGAHMYELEIFSEVDDGTLFFEINLYEPKLFQDTTVESQSPDKNNAFGAIGFIGRTKQFGEQWLYSRPDFSKIPDLTFRRIRRVLLHIPVFNGCCENVDVLVPVKRFCSFGSTWNKKVDSTASCLCSSNSGRYLTIDVTDLFTNKTEQLLAYNEGIIIKKSKGNDDFIAIATGDCYFAPQILEIKFE